MVDQMASGGAGLSFDSKQWIATAAADPEPVVAKWSRRRRYALIFGTPLLFWVAVFAAFHWG